MKTHTCCFTGHRNLPAERLPIILSNLDREIDKLIQKGVTDFLSVGALGFDQLAAERIIAKRAKDGRMRLIFALPCRNQEARWTPKQQVRYRHLLSQGNEVLYVSEAYNPLCMERRNRYMATHSAYCICALRNAKSGTGQTVRFA